MKKYGNKLKIELNDCSRMKANSKAFAIPIMTASAFIMFDTIADRDSKCYHYQPSYDIYQFSFLPRTAVDWNKLPIGNIHQLSLVDFKSYLTELLFINL